MGALKFWKETNHRDVYSRATSWHSRRSITWLWSLWYEWGNSPFRLGKNAPWFFWNAYRSNGGLQWDLKIGKIRLYWHKQKSMPRSSE